MVRKIYQLHLIVEKLGIKKENVFIFGGTIRDCFLHREIADMDVAIEDNIDFEKLVNLISKNYRLILFKEQYLFVKFIDPGFPGLVFDFQVIKNVSDFLRTRDFTVNSMSVSLNRAFRFFYTPSKELLIDLVGGYSDLKKGLLKTSSEKSFSEDPIRLLRAAYYSAVLNFQLTGELIKEARKNAFKLQEVKIEKIRENFLSMAFFKPSKFFLALSQMDIDKQLFGLKLKKENLNKIKKLEKLMAMKKLSKKDLSAARFAILKIAGIEASPVFNGVFSNSVRKKADRLLTYII